MAPHWTRDVETATGAFKCNGMAKAIERLFPANCPFAMSQRIHAHSTVFSSLRPLR